jgi:hypothetical protein
MSEQEANNQSAEPCLELIQTHEGPMWQVTGLGMRSRHQQRWQAMLRFDCMCIAKGIDPSDQYRRTAKETPDKH